MQDPLEPDWRVVVQMTPRDRIDKYSTTEDQVEVHQVEPFSMPDLERDKNVSWVRQGVDGSIIDTTVPDDDNYENVSDED